MPRCPLWTVSPDDLDVSVRAVRLCQQLADGTDDKPAEPLVASAVRHYAQRRAAHGVEFQQALTHAMAVVQIFTQLDERLPGAFTADVELARTTVTEVLEALTRA